MTSVSEIREAVIVDCARTAFGKRNGALAPWHPTDLLGFTLKTILERNDIDPRLWAQFRHAQVLADRFKISREDMDEYALESHRRAADSTDTGHFAKEIIPVPLKDADGAFTGEVLSADEGIRRGGTMESLA